MLYPVNIEEKIGFDKIKALLKENCIGSVARRYVEELAFSDDYDFLRARLAETEEMRKVIADGIQLPEDYFFDLEPLFAKASIEGSFLSSSELFDLKCSLQTLYKYLSFFHKNKAAFPYITLLCADLAVPFAVQQELDRILDETGKIRSNASPELQKIRKELLETEAFLRRRIDGMLRKMRDEDYVREDAEVTIREGRLVIPIKSEYKRHVKGIVHDSSATGQTLFVEPEEIVEINNDIKQLYLRERNEIVKILTFATSLLRPHIESLRAGAVFLANMDFIRAKAKLAVETGAYLPELVNRPLVKWFSAYHPLLLLSNKKAGKKTVPYDIALDGDNRILLISGPNAGGKSVCLKTVGLVQYMVQCGLLPPISEMSKVGIFQNLFADIGDEQSIENDLSTYSSHLRNMKHFVFFANKNTLCLIDEFGTGTEPQFGAAIAEAILEQLNEQKCFGVITTHYANLKFLAENTKGLINGAMRFDVEALEPLFELEIGKPGSSFALEVAKKIGLPSPVLRQARKLIGGTQLDVERVLRDLEIEKKNLADQNKKNLELNKELEQKLAKYEKLTAEFEAKKKDFTEKAKREAQLILETANKRIEETIKKIKEAQAEKETVKAVRKELEDFAATVVPEPPKPELPEEHEFIDGEIQPGDYALITDQNAVAYVLEIRNKEAHVSVGDLKMNVKLSKLRRLSNRALKKARSQGQVTGTFLIKKHTEFSPELDIRGMRAEDAIPVLENFADTAILTGAHYLRVIHGKGNGVLREITRNTFRNYKQTLSMEDEHADRGGAGITVIKMNL